MRIGREEIEKLISFISQFSGSSAIISLAKKFLSFLERNSQNAFARMRKRIFAEIEKIESKGKLSRKDRIKLEVLWEVMRMIEEEQMSFLQDIKKLRDEEK